MKTKKINRDNLPQSASSAGLTDLNRGTAAFADQRSGTIAQRKLREGMAEGRGDSTTLQLQTAMQSRGEGTDFSIQRKASEGAGSANKTGLPDRLKSGMENLSGYFMDDVKVHYNSSKPAQLQAHAYAQGTDIHLGPGQERHLPHEAWHVVQQKQGRVKPNMQFKGKVNINADIGLEKEADVMGAKAMQFDGKPTQMKVNPGLSQSSSSGNDETMQMWWGESFFNRIFRRRRGGGGGAAPLAGAAPVAAPVVNPVQGAVDRIKATDLSQLNGQDIGNSRGKLVYLFDANGNFTTDKSQAAFMVDTSMDQYEQDNYEKVRGWGVGVPEIYGHIGRFPIVQWIPDSLTAGGFGRSMASAVRQQMTLDRINQGGFDFARWRGLLDEVRDLIQMGYTSDDLQFMVEQNTGNLFVMDLEGNNAPKRDMGEDPRLVELRDVLIARIAEEEERQGG